MLLSAFRMHLLLPVAPLDPAAKYGSKLSHLDSRIGDNEVQTEVYTEAEVVVTGSNSNPLIEQLRDERERLLAQRVLTAERTVLRLPPPAASFASLRIYLYCVMLFHIFVFLTSVSSFHAL